MSFAKESWPFVIPFLILAPIAWGTGHPRWGVASLTLAAALLLFFRDPVRTPIGPPDGILAPADGLITRVDTVQDPEFGPGTYHRIVTFLSVFDVHIQRAPTDGVVVSSVYRPGKKVAAFRANAGEVNESHLTVLEIERGDYIGVRQIAGLLARRIVCDRQLNDQVSRGSRLGLIKFGSRVDLLVPADYSIQVQKGDRVRSGETLAALPPDSGASESSESLR